jgi:Chaperone of endosialidase
MTRGSGFNTVFPAQAAKSLPPALQQYLQNLGIVVTDLTEFGGTADRPTTGLYVGEPFFDTDLQMVVNWNGTQWANTAAQAFDRANSIAILANGVVVQANTSNSNYVTSPTVNVSVVADGTEQTNISFTVNTAAIGSVSGANGDIQFNANGVFGSSPALTYNVATETLSVPQIVAQNITAQSATSNNLSVTGQLSVNGFFVVTGSAAETAIFNSNNSGGGSIVLAQNGTSTGFFAVANVDGAFSLDAVPGDVVVRSQGGRIRFNTNGGVGNAIASISNTAFQTSQLIVDGNTICGGPLFATFNNGGSTGLPTTVTLPGSCIVWNISNGLGEADIINTFFSASTSFEWWQQTGTGLTSLMSLSPSGVLTTNGLTVNGPFSLPNTTLIVNGLTVNGNTNLNGPVVINTTQALSLTLNGAIDCGGGGSFGGPVLFEFNAGSFVPPTTSILGGFIFSNLSNGGLELDFYNTDFSATTSFQWWQAASSGGSRVVTNLMSLNPSGALTVQGGIISEKGAQINGATTITGPLTVDSPVTVDSAGGYTATVPAATQVNALTLNQGSQPAWILFQGASSTDFSVFNGSAGTVASFHQAGGMTINGQLNVTAISGTGTEASGNPIPVNFTGPANFGFNGASFNPFSSATGLTQGGTILWNLSNGAGEMDFVNVFDGASGQGGFHWWQTTSTPSLNTLMTLSPTGALTVTSVTQTSDANLKANVTTIANATNLIMGMNGVTFNWVSDGTASAGLIAQDVANVMPELVATDSKGIMGLNYSGVVGALVAAFKEQQAVITQLQAEVAALKSNSSTLTS